MNDQKIEKLIIYWQKCALEDLESSRDIIEKTNRYLHACFFLHLSCEKILKAYYVHVNKKHAPLTHNLLNLVTNSNLEITDIQKNFLARINEYNIESRYPEELEELKNKLNKNLAVSELKLVQEFYQWISVKLEFSR